MSIINTLSKPRSSEGFSDSKKFSTQEICGAMRTVVTYTLTDVFDLIPEESLWLSYHMKNILEPFETMTPKSIPIPVTHELLTRHYSRHLASREEGNYVANEYETETAELTDWVDIIMEMITASYHPLRPLVEASVRGQVTGVLTELGVGIEKSPRGALYLPNAVRFNLAKKDSLDD